MAARDFDVDSFFAEMVGQRCEGVDNPYGSIIRLDIGQLSLQPDEMPYGKPHGWRHLTIKSPWRLSSKQTVLCDWNDEGGTSGVIEKCASLIVGKTVIQISSAPPSWDLHVHFSDGTELFVFSDCDDSREEAWFILGREGIQVSASPQRIAEGGLRIEGLGLSGSSF